ncbi:hypothetical protein BD769DRAFT_1642962 [Suillus cothurnatus]|nr:hypothetical protein BD769DRAFT_1642962 [Suillus cothurnatus]
MNKNQIMARNLLEQFLRKTNLFEIGCAYDNASLGNTITIRASACPHPTIRGPSVVFGYKTSVNVLQFCKIINLAFQYFVSIIQHFVHNKHARLFSYFHRTFFTLVNLKVVWKLVVTTLDAKSIWIVFVGPVNFLSIFSPQLKLLAIKDVDEKRRPASAVDQERYFDVYDHKQPLAS